ncbi:MULTISPECIES: hypothetical protein [unclassified Aeromonas]|uniref:hypothetical protein n=1 Tax=unclassified Aeromonas TaxID=257493 RepID=UPI000DF72376|nr:MULTISPECIES: hypothetical protein [unclassified Aeromonas]RDD48360.1 hypothetical protein ASJ36_19795 [Aeromonas sp. ARM81]
MAGHGPVNDPPVITALKDHIALQYGRCLLNMNMFEVKLKGILPILRISGHPDELAGKIEADRHALATQTLGYLVKQFCERTTLKDEPDDAEEHFTGPRVTVSHGLDEKDSLWLNQTLTQLLTLRNELVHCFHVRFNTHSEASCNEAINYLAESLGIIRESLGALNAVLDGFKKNHDAMADFVKSADFKHISLYGSIPGQPVDNWGTTTIVIQLQQAEETLAIDGWTLLNDAILHIQTHGWPDLSPSQYDCSSWREVIHRAQLFDVDKRPSQGGVMTWYRTRLP